MIRLTKFSLKRPVTLVLALLTFLFFGLGYVEDIFLILFLLAYVCDELERYAEQKSVGENHGNACNFKNKKDCDIIDVEFITKDKDTN